jgi:hypothetical protein
MNFFRALISALLVAVMGAILLAGLGATPERGNARLDLLVSAAGAAEANVANVFRWVFVAALVTSLLSIVALFLMEERPLRGPAKSAPPVGPEAPPALAE